MTHVSYQREIITMIEVELRLNLAQYHTADSIFWAIAGTVPGLKKCSLISVLPGRYYLTLSGSRRAICRAARLAGISNEVIRRACGDTALG
jgi:hypothetical protein